MEYAPQSGLPPKSPNNKKKIALLSLGTCVLLGIIGAEVLLENNAKNTTLHTQDFSLTPSISQSEQLQVELNQANQNINQLKRQLFVRNSAPISAFNRKLQADFAQKEKTIQELADAIKTHETQLNNEKAKVATLESSLTALTDLIEIQKNSKERFHDTLKLTVESKEDDLEKHKGTLALANEEIDNLKARIAHELAEKQTLVEALEIYATLHHETNQHLAALNDEIAIERTVQTLASQTIKDEHQESLSSLRLELDKLKNLLESTQVKLENETTIKESSNQTVLALMNKSCLLEAELTSLNERKNELENARAEELKELGEKGAALEDELAFATAVRTFESAQKDQNHSSEIEALANNYREICTTCNELEKGYVDLERKINEFKKQNHSQLSDTLLDKSDVEQKLLFAQLESQLAQERMTIELEDISYALISAEHQRDLTKRNLEDHLAIFNEERQESALKIAELDAELHAERLEKQQLLSQLAETHVVKETEAGFTAEISQELERAYAFQDSLKDQINTHQALMVEKQEAFDKAVNQHQLEIAALEEEKKNVQSTLEHEQKCAIESKELEEKLTLSIHNAEEALKAANLAFKILEQESAEKISALEEALYSKEKSFAENLQNVSQHKADIEQQTAELEQTKAQNQTYIAELEHALKNAEASLHQAASALELYEDEIHHKTASLNEHAERKEALVFELNQHKDSLLRSTEVEAHLKQELERVLTEANSLSIQITALENTLKQKEDSLAESQDMNNQTKEEQKRRIDHLENALEEARVALENETRLLKELHIQEISETNNTHQQEAFTLNQKIAYLEDQLKQNTDSHGSTQERLAHLQQALKETEESLTNNIRVLEEEHQRQISDLTVKNQEALAISDTLSHELKQKEIQEASLKYDLEKSQVEKDALNHELKQKESLKDAEQKTIEQHEAKLSELQIEKNQVHAQLQALHEEHQQKLSDLHLQKEDAESTLKQQLQQALAKTESLCDELKQKDEAHQSAAEAVQLYETHFADLQGALEEVRESLISTVLQLKEKHSKEVALFEEKIQEKEQIELELRNLETSKAHLAEKYNEAIGSIEQLQQEINAKEGTLQISADQVNHLKMEVEYVQNALISEKKESEDLLLQLERIKNQYEATQTSLEEKVSLEARLQSLTDALEDQADELNQLRAEKEALENNVKEAAAVNEAKKAAIEID